MASLSMLLFGCDDTKKKKTEAKPDVVDAQSGEDVDSVDVGDTADAGTPADATSTPDAATPVDAVVLPGDVTPQG
jgi:hypothetical protein